MKKKILFLSILAILLLSLTCIATNYYNLDRNYNIAQSSYDSMISSILEMLIFVYAIAVILGIIRIIAICFIFDLAGQAWWKALIPIYNSVVLYKIVGLSPWLLLLNLVGLIPLLGQIIEPIILIVFGIIIAVKLAKAFGKSGAFTCGLIFLPTIFYCILAFGDSEYQLINKQDEFFNMTNTDENKKNSKKSKKDEYIVVDPETGEEINPDFYKPMDLTDYKPKSDFFK